MSTASIIDEVHKLIKEELARSSLSLQEQFRQQLEVERQDRQFRIAELRQDVMSMRTALDKAEQCSEADSSTASMGGISGEAAMFWSSSMSRVTQQIDKLREELFSALAQQRQDVQDQLTQACQGVLKTASDSEQLAAKITTAESAISELRHNFYQQKAAVESVRQEAAMQGVLHQDLVQQRAQTVDIRRDIGLHNDHMQELNRELDAQRMQLMEQSSKFTVVAADSEELKLKISTVQSALDEMRAELNLKLSEHSGAEQKDLSMQSELHSNFVALKETVAQLRSDLAVKSNIYQEHLVQQAAFEKLRQEVSTLKLSRSPCQENVANVSLQAAVDILRQEVAKLKLSNSPAQAAQENIVQQAALDCLREEVSKLKLSISPAEEQLAQQAALESLRQEVSTLKLSISPAQEHLIHQAALDTLREEVSSLKLSISPSATTGVCTPRGTLPDSLRSTASESREDVDSHVGGLQESTRKLREEMEQKFTLLEQTTQALLNLRIDNRLEKVEDRVQNLQSRQNAFGDVVQLATTIIKGTQQNQERSIQDSVQMRTFMMQADQRMNFLEKFLPNGGPTAHGGTAAANDGVDAVAKNVVETSITHLSKRTASNEARSAALERRVEQLQQLHTSSESSGSSTQLPANEDDVLLSLDLKNALESLVTKINHMGGPLEGAARSASPYRPQSADNLGGSLRSTVEGIMTAQSSSEFSTARRIVQNGSTRAPHGGIDKASLPKGGGPDGSPSGSTRAPVGICQPGEHNQVEGTLRSRSNTNFKDRMMPPPRVESQSKARSPVSVSRDDSTARSPAMRKTSIGRESISTSAAHRTSGSPRTSTSTDRLAPCGPFKSATLPSGSSLKVPAGQNLGGGVRRAPETLSADTVVSSQSPVVNRRYLTPNVGPSIGQTQASSLVQPVRAIRPASIQR